MNTKLLRQKVLDLAIHGKLVPQNPEHEPASKLLERIRGESLPLATAGKPSSAAPSAGSNAARNACSKLVIKELDENDIPFEIPNNWCWCRLGEIAYATTGSTPSKECFVDNGIPYLKMYNIRNQKIDFDYQPQYITEEIHNTKLFRSRTEVDDLLMNIVGPPLGKMALIPDWLPQCNFNQAAVLIRPFIEKKTINKYLFYYLSEMSEINSTVGRGNAGQVNISLTQTLNFRIPLPPLEEQKLIVKEIERIFALIDTVEQNKTDLETVIKQTKSKILDLAIHGKLVPQDPSDESAAKMLEKLRAENTTKAGASGRGKIATGQLKRDKNDSYIYKAPDNTWHEKLADGTDAEIEVPFEIPESWSWCRLGFICDYGKCQNASPDEFTDDSWILDLEDIEKDTGRILQFVTYKDRNSLSTKHPFNKGDLLYSKLRPYLNKVVIAPEAGFCTSEIIPLNFGNIMNNNYAQIVLMSSYFLNTVNLLTYGVKMPRLGADDAKKILIPVPPISEQKRITNFVTTLFSLFISLDNIVK